MMNTPSFVILIFLRNYSVVVEEEEEEATETVPLEDTV